MFSFANEEGCHDDLVKLDDFNDTRHSPMRVGGCRHKTTHLVILKALSKCKSCSVIELSKKSKISIQNLLIELPFLDSRFFKVDGNYVHLADSVYGLDPKSIEKKFKKDV